MNKLSKKIIQIVVSGVILAGLCYSIDLTEVADVIRDANYAFVMLAYLLVTLNRIVMAYKWNLLLRGMRIFVPHWTVIKRYYISTFFGLFLPPTVGADVLRAILINDGKNQLADIASSIVLERAIGFAVIFACGGLGGLLLLGHEAYFAMSGILEFIVFSLVASFICIATLYLTMHDKFNSFINRLFNKGKRKTFLNKSLGAIEKTYNSYLLYSHQKKLMWTFTFWTFVETLLVVLWTYVLSLAFSVAIPFILFLSIVPIVTILIRLPFSIAGFGVHEGSYAYFLGYFGFSWSLGLSLGILDHFIIILGILPGLLFFLFDPTVMAIFARLRKSPTSAVN